MNKILYDLDQEKPGGPGIFIVRTSLDDIFWIQPESN